MKIFTIFSFSFQDSSLFSSSEFFFLKFVNSIQLKDFSKFVNGGLAAQIWGSVFLCIYFILLKFWSG